MHSDKVFVNTVTLGEKPALEAWSLWRSILTGHLMPPIPFYLDSILNEVGQPSVSILGPAGAVRHAGLTLSGPPKEGTLGEVLMGASVT